MLCCGYTLTDFPISIRLTSLALWQSNDCPSASKATLMNMDKYSMWIHYERLHNHNKAKHNKTVCIFLGIYCMPQWTGSASFRVWLGTDQALPESLLIFLSIEPVGTNFNEIRIKTQNLSIFCSRVGVFFGEVMFQLQRLSETSAEVASWVSYIPEKNKTVNGDIRRYQCRSMIKYDWTTRDVFYLFFFNSYFNTIVPRSVRQ